MELFVSATLRFVAPLVLGPSFSDFSSAPDGVVAPFKSAPTRTFATLLFGVGRLPN